MPVSFGGSFNVPAGSYLGTWDADTNTPTLASSTAPGVAAGSYYIVSVAGSTTLDGVSSWTVADWVIWSGGAWQKLEGGKTAITLAVTAVAGGATGKVLYDNNNMLGEYAVTGTGDVVLSDGPTLSGTVDGDLTFSGAHTLEAGSTLAPSTAPAAPASGWVLYVDTDDSDKLKAKAANGTVVTLGTP